MPPRKPKQDNPDPVSNPAGEAIRQRRELLGWTQAQLANEANLAQKTISQIERGDQDLLTVGLGRVIELAKALSWSLFDLQEATGLDFSLGEPGEKLVVAPVRTYRLYPIQEAPKWPAEMKDHTEWPVPVWNKHQRPGLVIFFEGNHPETGGILHYIDTHEKNPVPDEYYLVVTDGKAMVCEYKATGGIGIFLSTAGIFNPKEVTVIGHRYMQTTMRPAPQSRIAN